MPVTLLALPRELRDEIFTYVALSSNFAFLLTCHQLKEEGTRLLYKHAFYRVRALKLHWEHLPAPPRSPPISLVQNLHISMPPIPFGDHKGPNYEIPRRTSLLLEQFAGTETRRRVCHIYLEGWTLSAGMGRVISRFVGFDVVRVEVRLTPYDVDYEGRLRPYDDQKRVRQRDNRLRLIEERLGSTLGEVKWEDKESGNCFEDIIVGDFLPRKSGP